MKKHKICGIYQIVNSVNGKRYVGSSKDVQVRFRSHRWMLRRNEHHSKHLQAAWNKYGEDSFLFEVVEECSKDILVDRERYWIEESQAGHADYGYNMVDAKENRFIKQTSRLIYVWKYPEIQLLKVAPIGEVCLFTNFASRKITDVLQKRRRSYSGYCFTWDDTPPVPFTIEEQKQYLTGRKRGPYKTPEVKAAIKEAYKQRAKQSYLERKANKVKSVQKEYA